MAQITNITAEPREDFGKNYCRRLRRSGRVPAVVYGGGGSAIPIVVDPKGLLSIVGSEAGHTAILNLEIQGRAPARVMLKNWQIEPVRGQLLHVDMVRIAKDAKLKLKVPVRVTGEPKGVKVQGGVFEFVLREVEVECLPDDIPEHVTLDVSELLIGRHLRVADLPIGREVKVLTDPARVVAHVVTPRVEEKPAEAVAEVTAAEPEVIRKGKAEEDEKGEKSAGEKEEKKESK